MTSRNLPFPPHVGRVGIRAEKGYKRPGGNENCSALFLRPLF